MSKKTTSKHGPTIADDGDDLEVAEPAARSRVVSIDVELAPTPIGIYITGHLDVRLDVDQAKTMRGLFDALAQRGARLQNGRYVASIPDAVRWMLEEVHRRAAIAG